MEYWQNFQVDKLQAGKVVVPQERRIERLKRVADMVDFLEMDTLGCSVEGMLGCFVEGMLGCFVEGMPGCFVEDRAGCFVEDRAGCFVEDRAGCFVEDRAGCRFEERKFDPNLQKFFKFEKKIILK